jgi:hypothetical protein
MRANFIAHGADGVTASRKALGGVYGMVQQHAAMLAFVEAFFVMGVVFLLMLPFLPLLQYSKSVHSPKSVTEPEKVLATPDIPQDWQRARDVPAHDHAHEEEHDLVLH